MRCFIRYQVTARDLRNQLSAKHLTQQMVGEYLTFFQNYTRSKLSIAQNQTLFFDQFNQPKRQWLSGNIGYYSIPALHARLFSCEDARLEELVFRFPTIRQFQKIFSKATFSLHQFNQPKRQWLSGNIGYYSIPALHARLFSCEDARLEELVFRFPTIRQFQKIFSKATFSLHVLTSG